MQALGKKQTRTRAALISKLSKAEQPAALQKLEHTFAKERLGLRAEITQRLAASHNDQKVALKLKQLAEISDAYKEHAAPEVQQTFGPLEEARLSEQKAAAFGETSIINFADDSFFAEVDEGKWIASTLSQAASEATDESTTNAMRVQERQFIDTLLGNESVSPNKAGAVVRSVMKIRHGKEKQNLAVECAKESAASFLSGLKSLQAEQQKQR